MAVSPAWQAGSEYLGMLGPILRAEVGETIRVVFKNNATHPFSMHPHGVFL
jgi:FtsP/CotA-like multicopper oxidase with cupredoxin domain